MAQTETAPSTGFSPKRPRLALAVRQFADGEYWSSLAKYDQSPFAILAKEIYYRRSQYTIQF